MKQGDYSLYHEGKEIKKELKALYKRLRAETKELKSRYKKYLNRTYKALNDPAIQDDTDYMLALDTPMRDCMEAMYDVEDLFDGWDE